MTKKEQLQFILDDYNRHECREIHLIWTNGLKSGIGNPEIVNKVMTMLKAELEKQINEL